jgi:phage terminase large subunit-like protein
MAGPAWIFDGSELPDPDGRGQRAVDFLHLLKHPKSTLPKQQFNLSPFMERIVRRVYGDTENGKRRVKTVFLLLPRGNRKTTLGAGLSLLHTVGPERIPGGQVITAAVDRKQARIAFEEALASVIMEPRLKAAMHLTDARNRIKHHKSGSVYEAISAEAGTSHGRTPSFVLADELHAWKGSALWNVLRTGLVKVSESMLFIITTAGAGQQNLAFEIYEYAKKVDRGEIIDPGFLPILFESDREIDWRDEANWFAVNPGLAHGFPDLDGLRQLAREAENRPAQLEAFKQLHLNVWLDGSATPWLDMTIYDQGSEPVDLDAFEGEPCWLGVDLSSTEDLTAVVACFVRDDGRFAVVPWFFLPKDNLRDRQERDGINYVLWAEQKHITPTPGNVVDYTVVEAKIIELAERFRVMEIAIDRWNATGTINRLTDAGLTVAKFGQGLASMAPAVRETERLILSGKLQHGGHPVLRWNFANVALTPPNDVGESKFSKPRSADKIDGAIAAAMAIARASASERGPSIYESDDRPMGFLAI